MALWVVQLLHQNTLISCRSLSLIGLQPDSWGRDRNEVPAYPITFFLFPRSLFKVEQEMQSVLGVLAMFLHFLLCVDGAPFGTMSKVQRQDCCILSFEQENLPPCPLIQSGPKLTAIFEVAGDSKKVIVKLSYNNSSRRASPHWVAVGHDHKLPWRKEKK